jgi:hypothetical protein
VRAALARIGGALVRRLAASLGLGAAALVFSEFVFLNEGPVEILTDMLGDPAGLIEFFAVFVAMYAAFAYVTLVAMWGFRARGWAGLALSGAILGWAIEGIVIPLVYEAPPLSFAWPSLGWHMLVSFGVAWVAIPCVMRRKGWALQLVIFALAGLAWAGWARLFFAEDPAMILPDPSGFAGLTVASGAVLILGRWLADRPWARFTPGRFDVVLAVLLSVPMALAIGASVGPVSAALFALVALTLWAMKRLGEGGAIRAEATPPKAAYLRLAAFPISAALAFPVIPDAPPGLSFLVVLPLTAFATLLWCAAIISAIRYRPVPGQ